MVSHCNITVLIQMEGKQTILSKFGNEIEPAGRHSTILYQLALVHVVFKFRCNKRAQCIRGFATTQANDAPYGAAFPSAGARATHNRPRMENL